MPRVGAAALGSFDGFEVEGFGEVGLKNDSSTGEESTSMRNEASDKKGTSCPIVASDALSPAADVGKEERASGLESSPSSLLLEPGLPPVELSALSLPAVDGDLPQRLGGAFEFRLPFLRVLAAHLVLGQVRRLFEAGPLSPSSLASSSATAALDRPAT